MLNLGPNSHELSKRVRKFVEAQDPRINPVTVTTQLLSCSRSFSTLKLFKQTETGKRAFCNQNQKSVRRRLQSRVKPKARFLQGNGFFLYVCVKMNDLMTKSFLDYVELKKYASKDLETGLDFETAGLSHAQNENLAQFFEEIGAMKVDMEGISNLLLDLQALHNDTKSTHSAKILRGLRDQMDSDMVTILRKAQVIKARLEALDRLNVANRGISMVYKEGSSIDRTRISVTNGLRSKLRDMMNEFNSLREGIVAEHNEDLKRRYFNATGQEASEEIIEKMLLGGGQIEAFEKKGELNLENQERQEAVKQIQRSLMKLHQVFLDMALLVEAQGEHIDDIEQNVVRAGVYISGGTQHLAAANATRKKHRKWAVWIMVLVLILILVGIVLISTSS
ncbi:syntaxin-112 [Cinnamomum micranthum f. kanehirae]|uniref:Syntaxin-112 n=1 Tax=Cinnamomum micranthum f. kanehirae TaxID=337451 RepID=A0A3S3MU21_9MAGN|nr:syntaxin-112 [Cinnamomum micranthum f. kanehirae]